MEFITLLLITGLCLVFPPTRIYAVIGATLLLYFFFHLTLGFLIVAGAVYYFVRNKQRRSLP